MVREVVRNLSAGKLHSRYSLTAKENIFSREITAQIAFSHNPRRHVPVERSSAADGLLHPVAVAVIGVGEAASASDAILLIVGVIQAAGGIMGHIAGGVVEVATLQLIVIARGDAQVLRSALGDVLGEQIAPGIISVVVAPEFGFVLEDDLVAVCARVLR